MKNLGLFISCLFLKLTIGMSQEKPNIIFLMADDQASYTLGCYGNKDVKTPNIDNLSDKGLTFDHHYATTAICMASRATIMTGLVEYRTGTNFLHGPMKKETWNNSYPVLLKKSGYRTAFAGKFGFDVQDHIEGKKDKKILVNSFDVWAGAAGQSSYDTEKNKALEKYKEKYPHSTLAYGAFGSDFIIESVAKKEPFCLSISYKAPHRPATPDPRFNDVYSNVKFKKPDNYGRIHGEHFSKQSKQGRQYPRFYEWHYNDKYDQVMATYHQQVYGIDQSVGMILDALKESGADKNTVIIYTSDNGYFCGSHGYGSKVLPYEESSKVPLIIYDPRHSNSHKGIRSNALTANIDIAPTILALAGIEMTNRIDGKNIISLYNDPKKEIHKTIPLINVWGPSETHSLSIVSKNHKYIYWGYASEGYKATEELYNLKNDPLELQNMVNKSDKELTVLRNSYDAQIEKWKELAVTYNNYERYSVLFDRSLTWNQKASLAFNLEAKKTKKTKK
ncbi:sulfatase family protein [Wenyingzhuangia aestuarii]|uniref:sulfatase family protein n=1 Tax=Wenyingzhuangia aestuarii TaxID=1647582 RepID=UPI00143BB056|nr:sulfatase [Wenyingzhuangia aestuarii]NJB83674.1 arylsulfatase A-like enzyme [Wenyingzhuangia aestuarii]